MEQSTEQYVLTFGVFDLFHLGHAHFLQQARKIAAKSDCKLVAVITRDSVIPQLKNKKSIDNQDRRLGHASIHADITIFGDEILGSYTIFKNYPPKIICLGYDQGSFKNDLIDRINNNEIRHCELIDISAYKPEIYSTSAMRLKLQTSQ